MAFSAVTSRSRRTRQVARAAAGVLVSVRAVVAAAWLMPGTWVMVAATCRPAAAACSGVVMSHPTRQPAWRGPWRPRRWL